MDQSSPKFMKPFDVFMRGRKRQRELDDDYSPLKCLSANNSQTDPVTNNCTSPSSSSLGKVRRRIALTPVKTGSPSQENLIHEDQENQSESSKTSPVMGRHSAIKRQLNFGGIFSPSSPSSSANNSNAPSQVSNKNNSSPPSASAGAMSDSKGHSGRKEKRKRKSVSDDLLTSSKQKPITAMFKPIVTVSPSNASNTTTPNATAKQKADLMTAKLSAAASSSFTLTHVTPSTTSACLPVDWSLKTRVRITCKNFPQQLHRGSFKLSEDAAGITSFTRCISHSCDNNGAGKTVTTSATTPAASATTTCSQSSSSFAPQMDTSGPALLRQNTMAWCFPSISYLQPLFPRIGAQVNSSAGVAPSHSGSLSQAAIECLEKEFTQSLRSLIALCKARQCPYFYVCAATFTVLFRAAGIGGMKDSIHALVTPTTKGFRKQLTDYGIGFVCPYEKPPVTTTASVKTTPVNANTSNSSNNTPDSGVVVAEEPEEIITLGDDEEDPDTILTELGLSQQDFPSLQSKPKSKGSSKSRSGSSNATSSSSFGDKTLIMICGTDVQPFANLLCESVTKIASAKTGRLAGLPPTIVSPVAFIGSTLTPFKIKHARNKGNSLSPVPIETFDIIGPILPTNVIALVKQFRSHLSDSDTAAGSTTTTTTMNLITEENTTPFSHVSSLSGAASNAPITDPSAVSFGSGVFLQQSLSDSGLPSETIAHLCSPSNQARKPVREVIFCPNQEYLSYT